MSLPAPLMFTVGLIDQITRPIAKISQGLSGLASNYQAGTMQMASGIGGIAASGYALQNALMPAIEMDRALGGVKSLGVEQDALKQLANTSYDYALQYGKSATEFVNSAYQIQSAIAGLNGNDLSAFTKAGNVLAAATKADAETITDYMGTMYGIFKNDAKKMGDGAWVERLTGMTATAVKVFKTDGKKMADAFSGLGAKAGLVPLEEQMAVLGTLQTTMQGGESATKYKAFLAGAGKAQKALGLSFVDSNGKMLPMINILEKIKGKYGDLSTVQADIDKVTSAFGSGEATDLIQLLLKDVDGLKASINSLGSIVGMEQAEKMAKDMTDQSQRLAQSWWVIRAAFGSAILPAFNDFVKKIADMGTSVIWFTQTFPNITKWLGYLGVAMLSVVAIGGIFTAAIGGWKMAKVAWTAVTKTATWAKKAFTIASMKSLAVTSIETVMTWGMVAATKAVTIALWLGNAASKAWAFSTGILTGAFGVLRTAVVALNIAALANPLFWIPAAIVAVGALIYYWDDLTAAMSEWGWIKALGEMFDSTINGIIDALNMIPGVNIHSIVRSSDTSMGTPTPLLSAITPVTANVPKGGQQITSSNTQSKSTTVGTVNVYPSKGEDINIPAYLEMHS
ncbi:phage tail tape measure protein [Shewanella baltica]|uniref:phage tail tape measure protein n=1 Tax=Shewanella baltica TaxID=62322 RepID=UPI002872645F|nr:phage tail tape measure protein [Shewanella baltica]MDR9767694.1 phage tail tape measure protein [Shewanella baltica]